MNNMSLMLGIVFVTMVATTMSIQSVLANPNCDPNDNNKNCPSNNSDDNHGSDIKVIAKSNIRDLGLHEIDVSKVAKGDIHKPIDCYIVVC
jgi:hypothetical protein